jgi:hypothetical protein
LPIGTAFARESHGGRRDGWIAARCPGTGPVQKTAGSGRAGSNGARHYAVNAALTAVVLAVSAGNRLAWLWLGTILG